MLRDYDKAIRKIDFFLANGKNAKAGKFLLDFLPADIAYLASHARQEYRHLLLMEISAFQNLGEIIHEMSPEIIVDLVGLLKAERITWLFSQLDPDNSARVLSCLPEELSDWVFSHMKSKDSIEATVLLEYNEEQAGRIMSPEYFSMNEKQTVLEAIQAIRSSPDAETIYYVYVVDEHNHLLGVASLREVLTRPDNVTMREIMNPDVIFVTGEMDREKVAKMVERYNFTAVPVIDKKNRLIGVITVDDIIDVIRQETTEDIMKLAGTTDKEFSFQSPYRGFLRRMPWLMVSFCGGMLTIQSNIFFEAKIPHVEFIFFITIIAGMGGNIASQSSTIVVRGLATGKIMVTKLGETLAREISIGLLLGVFFGCLLGLIATIQFHQISLIGISVCVGMFSSMLVAATVGALMPIIFQRIKVDPAVATGPFVSTTIDNLGLISYFSMTMLIIKVFG